MINTLIIIFILLFLLFSEAVVDVLLFKGYKVGFHIAQLLNFALIFIFGFCINTTASHLIYLLFSYISLRIVIFNPMFNLLAGLPVNYIGNTDIFDKLRNKLSNYGLYMYYYMFEKSLFIFLGVMFANMFIKYAN